MGDLYVNNSLFGDLPVIVSTVQTQCSKLGDRRRMSRFNPKEFGVLVVDECFPAGTLVDGRPIESIKIGDKVKTHNGYGTVTHCFKKPVDSMCVITFQNRETLVCTPNHPIWTQSGFKCAAHLTLHDVVATIIDYEQLRNMQNGNPERQEAVLCSGMQVLAQQGHHPEIFLESRRRDHKVQEDERNERPSGQGQGVMQAKSNGLETHSARGERTWAYAWVAMQRDSENSDGQTQWLSELLQTGCWKHCFEDWGRGGRILTLSPNSEGTGRQEGGVLEFQGVASVKIYEPSDSDSIKFLCPEGVVYNLEVSNGNTYFAAGVLVHNCHHATARSYRDVINYYTQNNPDLKVLGVTATPDRADEQALGQLFNTVAFDYEILDAIQDGWLVPIKQQFVNINGLDFSNVRTTAGDLNGAELSALMEAETVMQGVTGAAIEIVGDKRAIVFTCSVKQAEQGAEIFNRHRANSASWVCGETNKDKRREMLDQFKTGKIQVVFNCGVLTEGFDDPGVEFIVMARPTKSRSLYAQMAGRGTRPLDGLVDRFDQPEARREAIAGSAKPCCTILDFVGNSGKHKLMTSADILGGKVEEEVLSRAVAKAKKLGVAVRMDEVIDEEIKAKQKEQERRRLADEAKRSKLKAKVQFSSKTINPFDAFDMEPVKERGWDSGRVLSQRQQDMLMRQGINPDTMSYSQGKQVLNEMFRRFSKKLCSVKQAAVLKKFGFNTHDVTSEQAKKLLDQLKAKKWAKPTPQYIQAVESRVQQLKQQAEGAKKPPF